MVAIRWALPEWHESTGSTNALALEEPWPGRVVVARHQSAGRGRRGRTWTAPPGTALAVTAVVPAPAPAGRSWVPLLAGLAVARALQEGRYAVPARLKWPNDVLAGGAKVCGVLAQSVEHPRHGAVVVVGAGLNVHQETHELPVATATSWRLAGGRPVPVAEERVWLDRYLAHLAAALAEPEAARAAYRSLCDTLGRAVAVHLPDGTVRQGRASAVLDDGALEVTGDDGRGTVHHAGDVVHLRPAG